MDGFAIAGGNSAADFASHRNAVRGCSHRIFKQSCWWIIGISVRQLWMAARKLTKLA